MNATFRRLNSTFEAMKKVSELQKRRLRGMAAATLLGMPLIGWVIARFAEVNLLERWSGPAPIWQQLLIGIPVGLIAAYIAKFIVHRNFMKGVRIRYARMIGDLDLNRSEILFISVCAGVGEELLFRGVLQPMLGIIITAVLFVGIHGYLNPRDWRISVYGVAMTLIIVGLGYLTEIYGVWTAAMAHTLIDVVLLADDSDDDLLDEEAGAEHVVEEPFSDNSGAPDANEHS